MFFFRPRFGHIHPPTIAERAPEVLATWMHYFPDSKPSGKCDFEDWVENVLMLHHANYLGIEPVILERNTQYASQGFGQSTWMPAANQIGDPATMLGEWSMPDYFIGFPGGAKIIGTTTKAVGAASDYWKSETFQKHCGRSILPMPMDRAMINAGTRALCQSRQPKVFMKTVMKRMARSFEIAPASQTSPWQQMCDQFDGLDFFAVEFEGNRNTIFLLQEYVPMRYEYRIVIMDGEPVTGAGCIEHHTPLDNVEPFDPQMTAVRNHSPTTSQPELRNRYLGFAETFAELFAKEHGERFDYGLDLCIDDQSRVCIVELNPAMNLGRYACDLQLLVAMMIQRQEALRS